MASIDEINKYYTAALDYVEYIRNKQYELRKKEILLPSGEAIYNELYMALNNFSIAPEIYFCRKEVEEVLFLVLTELKEIYQDSIDLEEIGNIYNMIRVTNGTNPFEGSFVENPVNNERYLLFDRVDVLDSVPVIVHEGTHYLQDKYTTLKNGYHTEILSMLLEMIVASRLSDEMHDVNIFNKNISNRFKTLNELIAKQNEFNQLNNTQIGSSLESKSSFAKTYIDDLTYTYIVSFAYAYQLYRKYKCDPEYMLKNIRNIFTDYTSVDELVSYYGIEFKDPSIITNIRKEMSLLKK